MSYKKNILQLISGASLAQAVPILISPILSRLYTPQEFGSLAIYMSLVMLLSVFAAGRYDFALIEPEKDTEARALLVASLTIVLIFCIFIAGIIYIISDLITDWVGKPEVIDWIMLSPLTVITMSCISIFTYWLNRCKNFRAMSLCRIINSFSVVIFSLLFAFTDIKTLGLILGYVLGGILTVGYIWITYIKKEFALPRENLLSVCLKYSRYPKFLIPATLAGTVASESIPILLTKLFDATVSGLFYFVNRVTLSPISIIGNSIGEVYRIKATEQYQKTGECLGQFRKSLILLVAIGFVPWIALFFFGPQLFVITFGEQWRPAGEIAEIMSFVVWFQLISSPLSHTIVFNQSQNLDLFLQIFRMFGSILSIILGFYLSSYIIGIKLVAMTYCLYYVGHTFIQYRAAKGVL